MKYLRKFTTQEEYDSYLLSADLVIPNVSIVNTDIYYYLEELLDLPLFIEAIEPLSVSFSLNPIEYSLDGSSWNILPAATSTPTIEVGNRIYFRASDLTATSAEGIGTFSTTGRHNIGGNIMSMLYGSDFKGKDIITKEYAFRSLFIKDSKLVSAKRLQLPAMTLSANCYRALLNTCTSLVDSPKLPAMNLADYCYAYFFQDSTSITQVPELPATTMKFQCYQCMFKNCTSLITAPKLPALNLAQECYGGMFMGCSSLTTAPELPATTLAQQCYGNMFVNCKKLEVAPVLPASIIPSYGYKNLFNGCSKLRYIKCLATNANSSNCGSWVYGVASSGVFVKKTGATWRNGAHGIPSEWSIETIDE